MEKENQNTLEHQVIAMENTLARKSTKFTVTQQRLFYITLAGIDKGAGLLPDEQNVRRIVELDKEEIFKLLGITGNDRHKRLRQEFIKLAHNSYIMYGDDENFNDGFLVTRIVSTKKKIRVAFEPYYLPLLVDLSGNYTRLLSDDVITYTHKSSMLLYQHLMSYNHLASQGIYFDTDKLKRFLGLAPDAYIQKNGKFQRTIFERAIIQTAVDEINQKSRCIRDLTWEKRYMVNNTSRRVAGYRFKFSYHDPADQKHLAELEDEANSRPDDMLEIIDYPWWDD